MQSRQADRGAMLDRFPHEQIIWPQMLKLVVRRAKLVEAQITSAEKDRGGDGPALVPCDGHKPVTRLENVPGNILEKFDRLRRQSVPAPAAAMQREKNPHGLGRVAELHFH